MSFNSRRQSRRNLRSCQHSTRTTGRITLDETITTINLDNTEEEAIDLTSPDVVDLTSPVVILGRPSDRSLRQRHPSSVINLDHDSDDPVINLDSSEVISGAHDLSHPVIADDSSPERKRLRSPSPEHEVICNICLDSLRQIRRSSRTLMSTNCGHVFCSKCLHLVMQEHKRCPSCRKKLRETSIHPLYI